MQSIISENNTIHFNKSCYTHINAYINSKNISSIFVLVDENTHEFCLPKFLSKIETKSPIEIVEIESGEIHKTIDTCLGVWNVLSELGADRKSLIINLGGGVITDLGGFVASTFKRGIPYINAPTTLLAMVDASVGGKTGVDLGHLKNQVGVINTGEMVLIDTSFLMTLPDNEFRSGMAEMFKHGLIQDESYWDRMRSFNSNTKEHLDELIYDSVIIKHDVVTEDPNENGLRKTLNFGHTLGHAIESYFLESKEKTNLLHGEAVAIGMILECFISNKQLGFPKNKLEQITEALLSTYKGIVIHTEDHQPIIDLLKFDKKNEHGNINFVLLEDIGTFEIDCQVDNALIIEAFAYYDDYIKSL